jgi:hypothetical protein
MAIQIRKASRQKTWLKVALTGVTGAGKTYSALQMAKGMTDTIGFIDTENGSGELYSNLCEYDYIRIDPPFTPTKFVEAIQAFVKNGNDVIIIDSLSHAWKYVLDYKDGLDATNAKNWAGNWRKAKKLMDETMTALLQCPAHVIVCMREKSEYTETVDARGSKHLSKTGTQPIAEPDLEFEFTVCLKIDRSHQSTATKDRTEIWDIANPFTISPRSGEQLMAWHNGGLGELIRHPDWQPGLLVDGETQELLQEASRINDGAKPKSKPKTVTNYRDVVDLWEIKADDWKSFRELTFPEGKKPSDALLEGYRMELRDLQDVSNWVIAGCPVSIDKSTIKTVDPYADDDSTVEPTVDAPTEPPAQEPEPQPDPEPVEPPSTPVESQAPDAVVVGEQVKPKPATMPEFKREFFGFVITCDPLIGQFTTSMTDGQIKLMTAKYERRKMDPELFGQFLNRMSQTIGVDSDTNAFATLVIDFLDNCNEDSIDLVIAEVENPQGTLIQ